MALLNQEKERLKTAALKSRRKAKAQLELERKSLKRPKTAITEPTLTEEQLENKSLEPATELSEEEQALAEEMAILEEELIS